MSCGSGVGGDVGGGLIVVGTVSVGAGLTVSMGLPVFCADAEESMPHANTSKQSLIRRKKLM